MLPDDTYRAEVERTVAAVEDWCRRIADAADCEIESAPTFWRLRARPKAPSACPFEVILHRDQTWDLAIGPETYESVDELPLSRLLPMIEAIASGHVVTRTIRSPVTGRSLAIETIVAPGEPDTWQRTRVLDTAPAGTASVHQDRRYLPYRQG